MTDPNQDNRNVHNAVKSWIPNWLARTWAYSFIFSIVIVCDAFIEQLLQGTLAPLPGKGTPTALPYIGRSRGLIQGLLESDADYAARLVDWLTTWGDAGGAETLVTLVQTFLGNHLVVRLVDKAGNFVTANADGTTTKVADTAWDWDSHIPARAGWWSEMWLIVYVTDGRWPTYATRSDAAFLAAWGTYQGLGYGHQVPREVVDGLYTIIASFKGAHTWLQAIIFTTDTARFVPGTLGGIPAGDYGNWSKVDGSNHEVPARLTDAGGNWTRYWIPRTGG